MDTKFLLFIAKPLQIAARRMVMVIEIVLNRNISADNSNTLLIISIVDRLNMTVAFWTLGQMPQCEHHRNEMLSARFYKCPE